MKRTFASRSFAAHVAAVATLAGGATTVTAVPATGWETRVLPVVWDLSEQTQVWFVTTELECQMNSLCTDSENTICKHPDDELTRYVDFTDELANRSGVTLSTATIDATADSTLTVGTVSVTTSEITSKDQYGNSVTIAAGKAIQFKLSGGTAMDEFADPHRLVIEATLSDGDVIARGLLLRIEG